MSTHNTSPNGQDDIGDQRVLSIRDEFGKKVKDLLAKRVGNVCSNPSCRKATSGPHSNPTQTVNIGVAAHITAASFGGPRYDSSLTPGQRKDVSNGIWLCQSCAKLVDSDDAQYTKERLLEWKLIAESHAQRQIEQKLSDGWSSTLPEEIKDLVSLELTTPPPVTRHIGRSSDGKFWLIHWDSQNSSFQWSKVSHEYAERELQRVCEYRNVINWRDLFP